MGKRWVESGSLVCRSGKNTININTSIFSYLDGCNFMADNVFIGEVLSPDSDSDNSKLTVTSKATVQPVALMRLNIFVPSSRPAKGM